MSELVRWPPPPGAAGIVLGREGSMLLLGYASQPAGPLLGLPERPMDEERECSLIPMETKGSLTIGVGLYREVTVQCGGISKHAQKFGA